MVTKQHDNFNIETYRALLESLCNKGYEFKKFDDFNPEKRHILLRHDIDYSLEMALNLAEVEKDMNISSTYYILLTGKFYNPFNACSIKIIKKLLSMGHNVGLHLDASIYSNDMNELSKACTQECTLLEQLTQCPVTDVSFHRPAEQLLGYKGNLGGRRHSYQPCFFKEIGYVSDSRGEFRFGHPMDHEAIMNNKALQLLLHPIWWHLKVSHEPLKRLNFFLDMQRDVLAREMSDNSIVYRDYYTTEQKKIRTS
tara:strand:- start:47534 stop:48295 length:762 start_codon:yes stop_codon:yes gene_type:complete